MHYFMFIFFQGLLSRKPVVLAFSTFAIILLASFRGEFGPDTRTYFFSVQALGSGDVSDYLSFQPLWVLYNVALNEMGASQSIVKFNFLSSGVILALLILVLRGTSRKFNVVRFFIIPIIAVDLIMNTHRVAIALLLYILFEKSIFRYVSALGHYSIAILFPLNQIIRLNRPALKVLLTGILAVIILIILQYLDVGFLVDHVETYSEYDGGSSYRGASDIFLLFVLLNAGIFRGKPKWRNAIVTIVVCISLYFLCQANYAFVRIIKLVVYYLILTDHGYDFNSFASKGAIFSSIVLFPTFVFMWAKIIAGFGEYGF